MLRIIIINNTFEPKKDRTIKECEWEGKPVSFYIPPFADFTVSLNQEKITDFSIVPPDNSEIIIAPKQEISAIAGAIYTLFTGATIATTLGGLTAGMVLSYVAATAIVMAGSMLLSSVLAPQAPNNNLQSIESSPTYSWSPVVTRPRAGSPVPILYGTHRLGGNIIQRRIEYVGDDEYLYLQLALCMGEIENIYDGNVLLNDTPIVDYTNTELLYTNGTTTQDVMPYFGDIETPNSFNAEFTDTLPITKTTIGTASEALRLFINFPSGLYYSNNNGGLDGRSVYFKVEYRKVGDPSWATVRQQDSRFDHWEYEYTPTITSAGQSCFTAGQKVLMSDSTYKNIEDIKVGDKVQGAYGSINIVKYLDRPLRGDRPIYNVGGLYTTDEHGILNSEKDGFLYVSLASGAAEYNTYHTVLDKDFNQVQYLFKGLTKTKREQIEVGSLVAVECGSKMIEVLEISDKKDEQLYHLITDGDMTFCISNMYVSSMADDSIFDYTKGAFI